MSTKHLFIVVGAGPAGLSVANVMSKQGHEVVVLNRDIKVGGLAEYGIFPNKHKLRGGVRWGPARWSSRLGPRAPRPSAWRGTPPKGSITPKTASTTITCCRGSAPAR